MKGKNEKGKKRKTKIQEKSLVMTRSNVKRQRKENAEC